MTTGQYAALCGLFIGAVLWLIVVALWIDDARRRAAGRPRRRLGRWVSPAAADHHPDNCACWACVQGR